MISSKIYCSLSLVCLFEQQPNLNKLLKPKKVHFLDKEILNLCFPDNKSKDYAWFNKEIDVSELSPGTYSMNIYTKTQDAEDYGELNYLFGVIKSQSARINNKTYTTSINKNRNNRIELSVE